MFLDLQTTSSAGLNIEIEGDKLVRPFLPDLMPEFAVHVYRDRDPDQLEMVQMSQGRGSISIGESRAALVITRLDDGDILDDPTGQFVVRVRPIEETIEVYTMDFEDGVDGHVISSSIPGMYFTTTQGYDWIYGDKTTGQYNVAPYGESNYVCNGDFFAWLGPAQGEGRITFIGNTARSVSMKTSTYSGLYLEAYDYQNNLIDSDYAGPNTDTGQLSPLSISGEDIAYILVHDSGNRWLIDDLMVEDLLRTSLAYLDGGFDPGLEVLDLIQLGGNYYFPFNVEPGVDLEVILNWGGSELSLEATDPLGITQGLWRSESPPIIVRIDDPDPGIWGFNIVAHDIPSADYPFAFVVGASIPSDDETPPVVVINSPASSGHYSDYIPILFDFQAEDNESGIVSVDAVLNGTHAITSGQVLLVDSGANHTFSVTATNGAGLVTTDTVEFSVMDFEWLAPIANVGQGSPFFSQANRTIPVKFTLHDGDESFVISDDIQVVLEDTDAEFSLCDGADKIDSCVRLDSEDDTFKYIVNFHTNPQRDDYGIVRGDAYRLKVFVNGHLVASKEIVFPSFPVVANDATDYYVPGETQTFEWSAPEGVAFFGSTIYLTTNGGQTWDKIGITSGDQCTFNIAIPDEEYLVTQVMVVSVSSIGIIHGVSSEGLSTGVDDILPGNMYSLGQNVPNPFNPSTRIKFSLGRPCGVSLIIYDLSGRKVQTLLSGQILNSGPQEIIWDGTDDEGASVATGMYFYRIEADEFVETKQMTLVR